MLQFYQDVNGEFAQRHFNFSSKLIFVIDTTKKEGEARRQSLFSMMLCCSVCESNVCNLNTNLGI